MKRADKVAAARALSVRQCDDAIRAAQALLAVARSPHMRRKRQAELDKWQAERVAAKEAGRL